MPACVILSSRPVTRQMLRYVPEGAFLIAADAGWRRAEGLGLTPHLILGDFDSSAPPVAKGAECLRLPAEKDDTDTHFAAREALARGYREVTILGGLGGRLDHTAANLHTLLFLAQNGARAILADETTEVHCFGAGSWPVKAQAGRYMSVFAAGGDALGVYLRGVKYPLHNAHLSQSYPVGTSNEFAAPVATVAVREGYLFVMLVQKD